MHIDNPDVILIGSGIMSANLGAMLVARSRLLWGDGDAVHRFYQFSGLVVAILGTLWAMGIIWRS
ncbi:MAG: hypothetical protein WAO83_17135 [Fuerstiella sp.]